MSNSENNNNLSKQLLALPYVIVFLEVITFLSMDMYLPALPTIARDFNISQDIAQYTQALWFLGSMSIQLLLGPISEVYGRKLVITTSIIVFLITNITLATTSDINIFLIARLFQGTTVCAVIVAGYALVHELYSGKKAVQILAIMGSISILAPALGPVIGAVIITYSSWNNIFYLLAGCSVIGLIAVHYFIPSMTNTEKSNKIDIPNIISDYKAIFTNKKFMQTAFLYFSVVICFFIWIVESPFIIINHYQKTELYFGVVQLVVFSGYICGAQSSKRLISKLSAKRLSDIGLSIVTLSISSFLFFSYFNFNILLVVASMVGIAFGASSLSGLMNRLAIESSDRPMTSRVAVYSLTISFAASVGSFLVTLINDMTFDNIGCLMAVCFIIALSIYYFLRDKIELQNN